MKRSLVLSLVGSIAVMLIMFATVLGLGWAPKLGLDLAGGSEVVLAPVHPLSSGQMATTVNIIRNRIDGAGVSGANVASQGGDVLVQFPAVHNPQSLISLISTTAQLYFRPVLCQAAPYTGTAGSSPGPLPSQCPTASSQWTEANLGVTPSSSNPGGFTDNIGSLQPDPALAAYPDTCGTGAGTSCNDDPNKPVILEATSESGFTGRYLLGPSVLPGNAVTGASAQFDTQNSTWVVNIAFSSSGLSQWNLQAQRLFHTALAFDLGGQIESMPIISGSDATFTPYTSVQISGQFTRSQANNLAQVLKYGALPVTLNVLTQTNVTATAGKSYLKAGLFAGIGGLLLVLLYTIFYYRALGIVVLTGLALTAALLWSIVAMLGHSSLHLTLDLAGVTGLIVSVGITVDSYIVYFERLKDEARSGRTVRTTVEKAFKGAFRTVLAADLVSFLAAAILWFFAAGTVKGFAFFLGLSTILDVFTTYFFTRPLVILLGRSKVVTDAPIIGVARGLAVAPQSGAA